MTVCTLLIRASTVQQSRSTPGAGRWVRCSWLGHGHVKGAPEYLGEFKSAHAHGDQGRAGRPTGPYGASVYVVPRLALISRKDRAKADIMTALYAAFIEFALQLCFRLLCLPACSSYRQFCGERLAIPHPLKFDTWYNFFPISEIAWLCSSLFHPHVLTISDAITTPRFLCLVTDQVHGETLASYVHSRGHLPEKAAKFLFQQLCMVLSFCHLRSTYLPHLTPDNVVVDWVPGKKLPVLKLADCGAVSGAQACSQADKDV
jgi:hypothetical protein